MFSVGKVDFRTKEYFNKAFIFDIDPLCFYQNDPSLGLLIEAMQALSKYQNILFMGKCWMQLLDSVKDLINPKGRIGLLSGSGSGYFDFKTKQIRFFNFINQNLADFIIHLATSSTNGIMVQGLDEVQEENGGSLSLKTASYFLNYLHAKDVKNKWKIKDDLGFDYFAFKNQVNHMKIAEIYFFENDVVSPLSSRLVHLEDYAQNVNSPADSFATKKELVSKFEPNVYGFSSGKNNACARILEFLKTNAIALEDAYYISINSYDLDCINNLPNLILPEQLAMQVNRQPLYVYKDGNFADIGVFWFENSAVWRTTKI